ncbi:G-PROTEIN-RECEP-F1-2 domain-containing protein [Aphelenchoides bicaudatus]|nr:G-PROTEIN-RECEP-F1-2 domain-containing protein [Aphelenchoides bicaudatus]
MLPHDNLKEANLSCYPKHVTNVVQTMNQSTRDELNYLLKVWHGLIPLPIALVGLVLTLIYMFAVYKSIKQKRVSRKSYTLMLNKSGGDVFACLTALIISAYALLMPRLDNREALETMKIMDIFFICCFWCAMVSYVALSSIKLYSVWQPLHYRNRVTMQRCIYLVALSWFFFACMFAYALTTIAMTNIQALSDWSGCVPGGNCTRIMYRVRNLLVVTFYFFTIICFAITVVLVRRARSFNKSFHKPSNTTTLSVTDSAPKRRSSLKERFPLWKLALNVATFAFFNIFYVIWAVAILSLSQKCYFLEHFNKMKTLFALVRISLLARIVADPILAFITDKQVRRNILTLFGCRDSIRPNTSNVSNMSQISINKPVDRLNIDDSASSNGLKRERLSTKSVEFNLK